MSGGSSSAPQPQNQTVTQTNLPAYAQPYFEDIMGRAQAASNQPYTPYAGQRIAGFDPAQTQVQQQVMGLQTPAAFGQSENIANQAGLQALNTNYQPGQFNAQQVYSSQNTAPTMQGAQSNYAPNLTTFQMSAPQDFGQQQAQQYMSPYIQNVLDVQQAANLRNAKADQLVGNLGAARQGTYGGSRQLLATTERERNLGQLQNQTEATGLQSAYENAQQQFERDRAAGLGVASQNLQAQLGVQQLGTQTGTQMALANLTNQQQAAVQDQAAQLQTQGLNAQQAMQAALANQQANMQAQQYGEQSRQFGANLGLQGLAQATQSAQVAGGLAGAQQQSDLARLQAQSAVGQQQQQYQQQLLDQQYADFLRQRDYPMEQLGYYSNILHGVPVGLNSTSTTYAQPPSMVSQVGGLGLGALGLYNMAGGGTK